MGRQVGTVACWAVEAAINTRQQAVEQESGWGEVCDCLKGNPQGP